jgi:hypothetical protein
MFSVENKLWCSSLLVSMATEVICGNMAVREILERFQNNSSYCHYHLSPQHCPCSKLIQEQTSDFFSFLNHKVFRKMKKKQHLKGQFPFEVSYILTPIGFLHTLRRTEMKETERPVIDWAVPSLVGLRDLGLTLGSPEDYFQTHFHSNSNVNTGSV